MSDLRKAAQQALEALENHTAIKHPQQIHYRDAAINALRAALAESEQEPVAWMYDCGNGGRMYAEELDGVKGWAPLYTTPPQRKPLTEEEIDKVLTYTRAVEAAHNIKE